MRPRRSSELASDSLTCFNAQDAQIRSEAIHWRDETTLFGLRGGEQAHSTLRAAVDLCAKRLKETGDYLVGGKYSNADVVRSLADLYHTLSR